MNGILSQKVIINPISKIVTPLKINTLPNG